MHETQSPNLCRRACLILVVLLVGAGLVAVVAYDRFLYYRAHWYTALHTARPSGHSVVLDRAEMYAREPGRVVLLGDSRIAQLSPLIFPAREFSVVKKGVGGAMIADVLRVFRDEVLPLEPECVVIQAGINDMLWDPDADCVFRMERFLEDVQHLAAESNARLVISSVVPIAPRFLLRHMRLLQLPSSGVRAVNRHVNRVNECVEAFCERNRVTFVDPVAAFTDEHGRVRRDWLDGDGLHFSDAGNRKFVSLIFKAVDELMEDSEPGN